MVSDSETVSMFPVRTEPFMLHDFLFFSLSLQSLSLASYLFLSLFISLLLSFFPFLPFSPSLFLLPLPSLPLLLLPCYPLTPFVLTLYFTSMLFFAVLPTGDYDDNKDHVATLCGGYLDDSYSPAVYLYHDDSGKQYSLDNTWESSGDSLLIVFTSDSSVTAGGFSFEYEFVYPEPYVNLPLDDIYVEDEEAFTYHVPTGSFLNPKGANVLDYSGVMYNGNQLPSYLTLTDTGRLSGTPPSGAVGKKRVNISATNEFGYSAEQVLTIYVLNTEEPDSTTALSCEHTTITSDTVSSYTASDANTLTKIRCSITAKVGSVDILTDAGAFSAKVVSGLGSVSSVKLVNESSPHSFGTEFYFDFNPPQVGGETVVTDGVSSTQVTIESIIKPDLTTEIVCDSDAANIDSTVTCYVIPRKNSAQVSTISSTGSFYGGVVGDPVQVSKPTGAGDATIALLYSDNDLASSFEFQITLPSREGEYQFNTGTGSKTFTLTALISADTTSEIFCSPQYVVVGQTASCAIYAKLAGTAVSTTKSQFSVLLSDDSLGEVGTISPDYASVFNLTFEALSYGSMSATLMIDGNAATTDVAIFNITNTPDNTTSFSCGSGRVAAGSTLECDITARRAGEQVDVSWTAFTTSISPEGYHSTGVLREYRSTAGTPLADGYFASQYTFDVSSQSGTGKSGVFYVWDGISAEEELIVVTDKPDHTSTITCDTSYVYVGQTVKCYVTTTNGYEVVYTYPSDISITSTAGSSLGTVSTMASVNPPDGGSTKTSPSNQFEFSFTASTTTGQTTFRLQVVTVGGQQTQYAETAITVVDYMDHTSTLSCRADEVNSNARSYCTLTPRKAGMVIHAFPHGDQVEFEVEGRGTVSIEDQVANNWFSVVVEPTQSHSTISISSEHGYFNTVDLVVNPPGALYSWTNNIVVDTTVDEDTVTANYKLTVSATQKVWRSILSRDHGQTTFGSPQLYDSSETGSEAIVDLSCSYRYCLAVTGTGDILSWSAEDEPSTGVGRVDESSEAGRVEGLTSYRVVGVSVLESALEDSSIAITEDGYVFGWGTHEFTNSSTPQLLTIGGSTQPNITLVSKKGPYVMFAAQGAVYSMGTTTSFLMIGRGGNEQEPEKISLPSDFNNAVSLVAEYEYGVILDDASRIFSWGYGLSTTILKSGSVAEEVTSHALTSKTIVKIDGGSTALFALTSDGALYYMPLYSAITDHDWKTVSASSSASTFATRSIVDFSVGSPGVIAIDELGGVYEWYVPSSSTAGATSGTGSLSTAPLLVSEIGAVSATLLFSHYAQFVAVGAPTVTVDPNQSGTQCGKSSVVCSDITTAMSKFTAEGTTFELAAGTHSIPNFNPSSQDARIRSVGPSASDVILDCGGQECITASHGLLLSNLTIRGGVSETGGCLKVGDGALLTATNIIFDQCQSTVNGGAVVVDSKSTFECTSCTFTNNTASNSGGAIYVSDSSYLSLSNCLFQFNDADEGGAISARSSDVFIEGTSFSQNNAASQGGAIRTKTTIFELHSSQFSFNTVGGWGGALTLMDSTISIDGSQFVNNTAKSGGGALQIEFSDSQVTGSTFENNTATSSTVSEKADGGAIYVLGDRTLNFEHNAFITNSADNEGGAAVFVYCTGQLTNCTFDGNDALRGGAVAVQTNGILSATTSTFQDNYARARGGAVYIEEGAIEASYCDFLLNYADGEGGGVFSKSGKGFDVSNTTFAQNHAIAGGAAFLFPTAFTGWTTPEFENVTFTDNTADYGSQVDIGTPAHSLSWIQTMSSNFRATSGVRFGPLSLELLDFFGSRVAYDSESSVSVLTHDDFNFMGTTVVEVDAGVITFSEASQGEDTRFGISAAPGAVAEFYVQVRLTDGVVTTLTNTSSIKLRQCYAGEMNSGTSCVECIAGKYSNSVDADSCIACPNGTYSATAGSHECTECEVGKATALTSQTECGVCSTGRYSNITGLDECSACPKGRYAPTTGSQECYACEAGSAASSGASSCTACLDGTIAADDGMESCTACQSNSVSVNRTRCDCDKGFYLATDGFTCSACPKGADCEERGTTIDSIMPATGYWRAQTTGAPAFLTCLNSACMGESGARELDDGDYSFCREGYTGALCTVCESGYGRTGDYECETCPSDNENRLRIFAVAAVLMLLVAGFTYSTIKTAIRNGGTGSAGVLLKIVLSCLQFNSIAANFDFQWPGPVQELLDAQQQGANIGSSFLNVDCFLDNSNTTSPFYIKCIIFMVLPLLVLAVPSLVLFPISMFKKSQGSLTYKQDYRNWYVTSVVVGMFIVHPSITQQTFEMWSCKDVGNGDFRLMSDMQEKCWTSSHFKWLAFVSLPMLVCYVFGIPFMMFKMLQKNKDKLADPATKIKYGFLYFGYEDHWYYWECVVVARKVGLVAVAVFFASNTHVQSIVAVFLVTMVMMAHISSKPYENQRMDTMELFSLITSFATFWCGQFLFVDSIDNRDKTFFSFVIIGMNVLFLVAAILVGYKAIKEEKEAKEMAQMEKEMEHVNVKRVDGDQGVGGYDHGSISTASNNPTSTIELGNVNLTSPKLKMKPGLTIQTTGPGASPKMEQPQLTPTQYQTYAASPMSSAYETPRSNMPLNGVSQPSSPMYYGGSTPYSPQPTQQQQQQQQQQLPVYGSYYDQNGASSPSHFASRHTVIPKGSPHSPM